MKLSKLMARSLFSCEHMIRSLTPKLLPFRARCLCGKVYKDRASHDTIFALSSGQGKCGVAVIRVSGPRSASSLKMLCRTENMPKPRYASLRKLINPVTRDPIDKGLVIWFPGMII